MTIRKTILLLIARLRCALSLPPEIHYVGGSDNLPPPLTAEEERCALEALAQRPKALDAGSLQALRFILFSPRSRVFSFQLREGSLRRLGDISEAYVAEQMERGFRTLDYYKSI